MMMQLNCSLNIDLDSLFANNFTLLKFICRHLSNSSRLLIISPTDLTLDSSITHTVASYYGLVFLSFKNQNRTCDVSENDATQLDSKRSSWRRLRTQILLRLRSASLWFVASRKTQRPPQRTFKRISSSQLHACIKRSKEVMAFFINLIKVEVGWLCDFFCTVMWWIEIIPFK